MSRGFSTRATLISLIHRSNVKACKAALRCNKCRVTRRRNELSDRAVGFEIRACDDRFVRANRISLKGSARNGERGKCSDANRTRWARARDCGSYAARNYIRFAVESELIINLITAIYRAAARQVKPLVLKLQINEERTTITL